MERIWLVMVVLWSIASLGMCEWAKITAEKEYVAIGESFAINCSGTKPTSEYFVFMGPQCTNEYDGHGICSGDIYRDGACAHKTSVVLCAGDDDVIEGQLLIEDGWDHDDKMAILGSWKCLFDGSRRPQLEVHIKSLLDKLFIDANNCTAAYQATRAVCCSNKASPRPSFQFLVSYNDDTDDAWILPGNRTDISTDEELCDELMFTLDNTSDIAYIWCHANQSEINFDFLSESHMLQINRELMYVAWEKNERFRGSVFFMQPGVSNRIRLMTNGELPKGNVKWKLEPEDNAFDYGEIDSEDERHWYELVWFADSNLNETSVSVTVEQHFFNIHMQSEILLILYPKIIDDVTWVVGDNNVIHAVAGTSLNLTVSTATPAPFPDVTWFLVHYNQQIEKIKEETSCDSAGGTTWYHLSFTPQLEDNEKYIFVRMKQSGIWTFNSTTIQLKVKGSENGDSGGQGSKIPKRAMTLIALSYLLVAILVEE